MRRNRRDIASAIVFGVLTLWAAGPIYAQGEPKPDTDTGTDTDTDTGTGTDADADAGLHPPHLLDSPPPTFPPGREGRGLHPTVILLVTVTADAKVTDVVLEHSAGADFDAAAVEAIQTWTFEPATRNGTPVASRIRVAVHFEEPEVGVHDDTGAYAGAGAATDAGADTGTDAYRTDARVDAERLRSGGRGAADFEIDRDILNAAPVFSANDLLKRVPGLYASTPEGGAVGERFFLRGFDSEHGQDIEFKVGNIPINQPSHIHGQGYTYQGFIIPEVVRQLRVTEGVYDPVQGDFAIAGTIDYELGVDQRGLYAKTDLGSFRTFRQVAIFAPEGSDPDTFGAFQLRRTDGFGENRDGIDGSAMFQYGFGREKWHLRVHGGFAGARYNLAGVLRLDDIEAGDVGWLDAYPFDTARAQSGSNLSTMLGFSGEHRGENKRNSSFGLWLQFHDFRLKENFSGFLETDAVGDTPGDLIEQLDRRFVVGGNARHRTHQFTPANWAKGTVELGLSGRVDLIDQKLDLVEAPQNRVYEERIDADIAETDIGMWLDLDWDFTKYLNVTGGIRADMLFYNITDSQESVSPDGVVPYRRTAAGVAVGPRTAVTVKPIEELDVVLAYGQGFRSPQARVLIENESVPFTKVNSADIGLRSRVGKNDELKLALTGFFTKMNNDLIFEAHEARFEPIGPTTRVGAVFYAQARPLPWLYGAFSLTYVKATLDETPPPEPGEPPSGLQAGDPIPFVPPWLLRLDVGASEDLVDLGKHPLHGKLGFGYTFLGERPLRFSESSPRVNLLELNAGLSWWFLELGFQVFNLLNTQYAAQEFVFESNWDPSTPPTGQPARHIAAGAPRTFLFQIGFRL
ncbi:MAG: TonB-dependent receptor [Deltaproteobacteria bacterium]|nr:TonB-dependent receptor [Deltaproteobacteria bacterium]